MIIFDFNCDNFKIHHSIDNKPRSDQFPFHAHEQLELYYFIQGDGQFWVEGTPYPLNPHDILFFNAGEAHHIDINPEVPYERISIHFNKNLIFNLPNCNNLISPFIHRKPGENNLISASQFSDDFYKYCIKRIISSDKKSELQIITNLLPLLNEISNVYVAKQELLTNRAHLSSQIIDYINTNINQNITPDSIAKHFFISRSQLYSIFKKTTGSPVWEFINTKRLLLAKELLSQGKRPSNIYNECGFKDYTSFFRAYKKKFGISPSEQKRQ